MTGIGWFLYGLIVGNTIGLVIAAVVAQVTIKRK